MDGTDYLGTVIIRHRLTPALEREGGHIGYHVVPGHRRRGHATQLLAQAKPVCRQLGLSELLVTCAEDNLGSRRLIEANRGTLDRTLMAKPTTGCQPPGRTPERDADQAACLCSAPSNPSR